MAVRLPTRVADWRLAARTLRLVLSIPAYAAFALLTAAAALTAFVVPGNWPLVRDLVVGGSLPLDARLGLLADLYPVLGPGFSPFQAVVLLATALLVGANVSLLAYHVLEHGLSVEAGSGSVGGVVLGTLGAGCAACGSAILAAVAGTAAAGSLTVLPLHGLEFALLSMLIVGLSTFWLADGMRGGEIRGCPIDLPE